ncbi:hypothetical protein I2W78_29270 [Streptomyces spinoverrucosus]|uniref:hypothetical protein n=1 Tax=Streptomyces spinoverrucosus TaxID=284043 RepID=UPI0018C3AD17|nr:hypothetical protein [Streptomyces spinoverrucosus]MBG0855824.1 hypothetical protein [Streptomyces spinoverrucosus]
MSDGRRAAGGGRRAAGGGRRAATSGEEDAMERVTGRTRPERRIGIRTYGEVDSALSGLVARHVGSPQFSAGEAVALQWALGRTARAPVTGVGGGDVPDLQLLTAEVDATVVRLEDPTNPAGNREYFQGVYGALAWVCGLRGRLI